MSKGNVWLIFAPFLVAVVIVTLSVLHPLTNFGPSSNTFAALALVAIATSFVFGIATLFLAKTIGVWWRVLIGVLYLPISVFSLLQAGF